MNWKWYENGELVEVPEEVARKVHLEWRFLSDDRGAMTVMIDQLWAEIDRLRTEIKNK